MIYLTARFSAGLVVIALLVGAFFSQRAAAEDFTMSPGAVASLPDGIRDGISAQAQQTANNMLNYMLLKLDEVNRVCTLTGAQRIKLKVAAKGAVEYSVQEWLDTMGLQLSPVAPPPQNANAAAAREQAARLALDRQQAARPAQVQVQGQVNVGVGRMAVAAPAQAVSQAMAEIDQQTAVLTQQMQQLQGQPNAGAQANAIAVQLNQLQQQRQQLQQMLLQQQLQAAQQRQVTVVEEVVVNENGVNRVVRRVRSVPAAQGNEATAAAQQHVWTNALSATLTPEQKKLLADAEAQRTAALQNSATPSAKIVAQIDQHLLLDTVQRAKVSELVNTTIELPIFKVQVQRTPQLTTAIVDRIIRRIPAADMTAMLSPLQTTRWQQALQTSLPQGAQGAAVDVVNPANGMPFAPVPAAQPIIR